MLDETQRLVAEALIWSFLSAVHASNSPSFRPPCVLALTWREVEWPTLRISQHASRLGHHHGTSSVIPDVLDVASPAQARSKAW